MKIGLKQYLHNLTLLSDVFYEKRKKKFRSKLLKCHSSWVWIAARLRCFANLAFFCGFCVLFTESTSTEFSKYNFKTLSHGTIHTFKNYFVTVFSVFNFQFLIFNDKRYLDKFRTNQTNYN